MLTSTVRHPSTSNSTCYTFYLWEALTIPRLTIRLIVKLNEKYNNNNNKLKTAWSLRWRYSSSSPCLTGLVKACR